MITLTHLRALLERAMTHTSNPAILRLPEGARTVEGLARAYLPRMICLEMGGLQDYRVPWCVLKCRGDIGVFLHDPGTAHALLVALALALGLDPGVGGLAVRWARNPHNGDWHLFAADDMATFAGTDEVPYATGATFCSPTVAAEPDPHKALALAVLHALGVKP